MSSKDEDARRRDAQQRATVVGGVKGFLGGTAVALPLSYLLHKRWTYYRALPPSLKALGVIMIVVPSFVITAERTGLRYEREHYTGAGKLELDAIQAREEERWKGMTTGQKIGDLVQRHQYGFILGGWSLSMIAAFSIIARNRYQTMPQKIVQARMWAQGLTVAVLIAGGIATHTQRKKAFDAGPIRVNTDHSWRDIIDHEQIENGENRPAFTPQPLPRGTVQAPEGGQ